MTNTKYVTIFIILLLFTSICIINNKKEKFDFRSTINTRYTTIQSQRNQIYDNQDTLNSLSKRINKIKLDLVTLDNTNKNKNISGNNIMTFY